MYYIAIDHLTYLSHHGIQGQKWGVKNGPPYPLSGGDYSRSELNAKRRFAAHKTNKKRYSDQKLGAGTKLQTLSYDPNRTKDKDMFYASYKKLDNLGYNAFLNKKIPRTLYDENGDEIGTGEYYKWKITNKVLSDVNVASEESGAKAFAELYSSNRDFYNFVTDRNRMESHIPNNQFRYSGYSQARKTLHAIQDGKKPTFQDLQKIYRLYNYTIPSDGRGDARRANDVTTQRAKFFTQLKKNGYSAVLDTNDAIYNSVKATSPVIVFDTSSIIRDEIKLTSASSKPISWAATIGRHALGI